MRPVDAKVLLDIQKNIPPPPQNEESVSKTDEDEMDGAAADLLLNLTGDFASHANKGKPGKYRDLSANLEKR